MPSEPPHCPMLWASPSSNQGQIQQGHWFFPRIPCSLKDFLGSELTKILGGGGESIPLFLFGLEDTPHKYHICLITSCI